MFNRFVPSSSNAMPSATLGALGTDLNAFITFLHPYMCNPNITKEAEFNEYMGHVDRIFGHYYNLQANENIKKIEKDLQALTMSV